MHLKTVKINPEKCPTRRLYPFSLKVFQTPENITFNSPVTFFVGENGTGKSTLLKAICHKCNVTIWKYSERTRFENNPFEQRLYETLDIEWNNGRVEGAFFSSQTFQDFSQILDEWAAADSGILEYFGGKSLMTQSHGQSLMSYFKSRYRIKGIYFMDEPETALSPASQIELLRVIGAMSKAGHAQFIIATHSPILLAYPEAEIYSFDHIPLKKIAYEETMHYRIYRDFMTDREKYFKDL